VAWNIERGLRLDAQLAWLTSDPAAPRPDVVLLTEVDRGCSRTGFRHVFLEYARALAMDGAYGVEFVELPREGGPGGTLETVCEHGNAILSRYPIGNLEVLRHADQRSWYEGDEPRLGGRVAVAADVAVGGQRLRLYAVHYESGALDGPLRAAQAAETADHALAVGHTALVGGDMNAGTYAADLLFGTATDRTAGAFLERGFTDAHAALPYARRITHDPALVLDLIMGTSTAFRDSDVCPTATCRSLSDHNAVWTTLDL
jgi:endonuclease/exonuclease/phosphatase family metal-dependent hydrolase